MTTFPMPPSGDPIDRTRDYAITDVYTTVNSGGFSDFLGSINEVLTSTASVAFNGLGIIAEWRRASDEVFGSSDVGGRSFDTSYEDAREGVVTMGASFDLDKVAFYVGMGMLGVAAILLLKDA